MLIKKLFQVFSGGVISLKHKYENLENENIELKKNINELKSENLEIKNENENNILTNKYNELLSHY